MSNVPNNNVVTIDGRDRRPWALVSREKLLRAAIAEIADRGYEKARLVDIAKRADLTVGSIYTWFEDKTALFNAALEFAISDAQRQNDELIATDKFREVSSINQYHWTTVIAALLPRKLSDQGSGPSDAQRLLLEALKASWRDEEANNAILPQISAYLAQYEHVIDQAMADGWIDKSLDPKFIARLFMALPVGLTLLTLAGLPELDSIKFIEIYRRITAAIAPTDS
jgi:AcrR family transcriptional regulator